MNKILRYAFVAAMTAISSFTFAQSKTVTISAPAGDKTSADTELTITKDGVTVSIAPDGRMNNDYAYRIYKGGAMTIKSADTNMLKVEMTFDNYSGGKYLADGITGFEGFTVAKGNEAATWEGDAASIELKAEAHQVRVKSLVITLKDVASGINNVSNEAVNENAPIYNLAGQRVSKDYKGVVIQNGKKFINK